MTCHRFPKRRLVAALHNHNKAPRCNNAGPHQTFLLERLKDSPSCLADYFTWPQVALTHHVFAKSIETLPANCVKKRSYGAASGSDRTRDSTAYLRSPSRKL